MKYLSVCSGIEAATVAWHPLSWQAQAFCEIEPFPSAVLAHHYPTVPNYGDMTKFKEWPDADVDVLVGGTPCQSFSVAGLRKGLADPRGNLMLTYLAIADKYRPKWLVWENVPGVLSSGSGRDFGTFLGGLAELGYGFAYRVLDAQYVRVESHARAVPQRRRRVFVVGYFGDWRRAAAVLLERESLQRHPAPRREAGQGVAGSIAARTRGGGGLGTDFECDGGLTCIKGAAIGRKPEAGPQFGDSIEDGSCYTLNCTEVHAVACPVADSLTIGANQTFGFAGDVVAHSLVSNGDAHSGFRDEHGLVPVAFAQNQRDEVRLMNVAGALASEPGMKQQTYAHVGMQVRRLTPMECERLQGFPDGYTDVPHKGKAAADGPRYKALGNSMAVNVMSWIGRRIQLVEDLTQ